jgi:cytochrome c biogenesis protein CcmG/thiol:disulfide interchange protein DsbE
MKRNLIILAAVAAALIAVLLYNHYDKQPDRVSSASNEVAPKKGFEAPSFTLSSLDGHSIASVGGHRDKPVIVNFWASWCGPCEAEVPDLKTIYAKYGGKIDFYAVNATQYDTLRGAKDFVKELQIPFPVLIDAKTKAGDSYKVHNYPTSFIIDRDGIIQARFDGTQPLSRWEKALDQVTGNAS